MVHCLEYMTSAIVRLSIKWRLVTYLPNNCHNSIFHNYLSRGAWRECSMPYKIVYTLVCLNMHADFHIVTIRKPIKLHSNLIILEIIFTSKCRTWIVMLVVMMMMMIKYVAIVLGYLQQFIPPSLRAHSAYL